MINDATCWIRFCGACLGLVLLATQGQGQVRVGIDLENRTVMANEPIVLTIIVQNDADAPFVFNKVYNNAELQVSISRTTSGAAAVFKPIEREFVIMPGDRLTNLVELTSLQDMRTPGAYKVQARVRYEGLVYVSQSLAFDVVRGIEIDSRVRPLSGYTRVQLSYSLRYCAREGSEYAFLVIEDVARDISYGTFLLGPIVRVGPPAMQFDEKGRMVVAHQSGRNRFTRSVVAVGPDGATFVSQTHHLPSGAPYPARKGR
jgi:hypothetical protein